MIEFGEKTKPLVKMAPSDALRAVMRTQFGRYILITAWAAALFPIIGVRATVIWYAATLLAGAVRTMIERRLHREQKANAFMRSRSYPYFAMLSNAFWALAPALCLLSGHPQGSEIALIMIAMGYLLVVAQFNATPKRLLIASAPYTIVLAWMLARQWGTDGFGPLLISTPLIALSVYMATYFGYVRHGQFSKGERERNRLIAELDEARLEAERASNAKSMFLANMSHEIRTPMNGVLGMAELLMNTPMEERQRLYAETIHKSGGALLSIINDILDLSKIEAGRLELEAAPFNLKTSVEDVAALLAGSAREKGVELIVRVHPDLPEEFIGDDSRLRQVLTNLVSNAIKFTNKGYVAVNVSGGVDDHDTPLTIDVKDTGIGIAHDKLSKIFDSFQQADSSTTRQYGGTGLGLSISKLLVEEMGGSISARSSVGEGSTFTISLPLRVGEKKPSQAARDEADGAKVLIVDDIEVNRTILTEQCAAWRHESVAVDSAAAALAALRDAAADGAPFDLVITDFQMPMRDGASLARDIRADTALAATPIVMLTSVDEGMRKSDIEEVGIDAYLVKPARSGVLRETIVAILNKAPLDAAAENEETAEGAGEEEGAAIMASDKIRVLLAEDNEVNQLVVKHMLSANRYDLTIANNGREAVEAFRASPAFHFILMDVSMPELDGYEATAEIRAIEAAQETERTPIICLSAHVMTQDVERSQDAGMDDFLAKPVNLDKLEAVAARWTPADKTDRKSA